MAHLLVNQSGGVTRITLDKPPLNIMDIDLMRELSAALDAVRADQAAKVVVIGAQGKLFSAGVDIRDHTAERVEMMLSEFHALFRRLVRLPQPTVAAVQGSALGGGCELAMACDFVVASTTAKFSQPEIQVGVFPPLAALLLPRLVPRKKALEFILSGDSIDAQSAERLGLVNVAVPPEEFAATVDAFVARFTRLSGAVLRLAKRATLVATEGELESNLNTIEHLYLTELMQTADAREGLAAFMARRAPVWKDA
jgi:cyclohexa-1,5-dienecarbonyl-CoA hydratase